ncbi:MAG: hypothetical protein OXE92_01400 [Bacteroidetes bacterium]|nr:hypothetical protein [Bacteroidota bacterium]
MIRSVSRVQIQQDGRGRSVRSAIPVGMCVSRNSRKVQSKFECMAYGYADLNASTNILASGIGATGSMRDVFIGGPNDPSNRSIA